jgi:zinc protease
MSVGWFVPRNGDGTGGGVPPVAPQQLRPRPCGYRPLLAPPVRDESLPGGARLLVLPRRTKQTVHLQGSLLAGHGLLGPERWSAASLLPDMLERGTASYSRLELARAMEDRGIELAVSGESFNPFEVAVSGRCLARHWRLILELAVEMLRRPTFPDEELEKLRQLRLGELAQSQEDTFLRAFEAFSRLVYPPGHPCFRRPVEERRQGLEACQVADLREVHGPLYGPASLVLALVGDVEPDEVAGALGELVAGWQGGRAAPPELPRRAAVDAQPGDIRVAMADKPNLDVVLGHPGGLRRGDPDFIAAQLGNSVLGHSTLSSRLGRRLRDREGLTYGVISRFFGASLLDGPWAATFSVAPTNLERAIGCAREEIARLVDQGPDDAELDDERSAMAGSYRVGLATPGGVARELARLARHGLPVALLDELPEQILATTRGQVVTAVTARIDATRLSLAVAGELVDPTPGRG